MDQESPDYHHYDNDDQGDESRGTGKDGIPESPLGNPGSSYNDSIGSSYGSPDSPFGSPYDDTDDPYDDADIDYDDPPAGRIPQDNRLWLHPSEIGSMTDPRKTRSGLYKRRTVVALGVMCLSITVSAGGFFLAVPLHRNSQTIHTIQAVYRPGNPLNAQTMNKLGMKAASQGSGLIAAPHDLIDTSKNIQPYLVDVVASSSGNHSQTSISTGIIASSSCMIITSASAVQRFNAFHVIEENGRVYNANLTGYDLHSDIAALSIRSKCHAAPFDMSPPKIGQLSLSVSSSINPEYISLNRRSPTTHGHLPITTVAVGMVRMNSVSINIGENIIDCILMDTPFKASTPGTVLITTDGGVAGILVGQVSINGNMDGVFVPMSLAVGVAQELNSYHAINHGWLGVDAGNTPAGNGVYIESVFPGSAAQKAGLSAGDIIKDVNGYSVDTVASLQARLYVLSPGSIVTLSVIEAGNTNMVTAQLSGCLQNSSAHPDNDGDLACSK
jgi:S1-C subfamily serine protease